MKPIKPSEVKEKKQSSIPDSIIESVNEMIVEKWDGSQACFYQDDLIKKILKKDITLNKNKIFDNGFLDFESLFRKEGWSVIYDKPGYNEDYEASFLFTKKRNSKNKR